MKHYINIDSYITLSERLFRLIVDLDEGQVYDMYSGSIVNSLQATYNITGTKTFKVSAFVDPTITTTPLTYVYEDALIVIDQHDDIDTELYDLRSSTFLLPVTSMPQIYPNDWGVSNVFNNTILQIQNNLEYLIKKTYFYDGTNFHFIGWYGTATGESLGLLYNTQNVLENFSWQLLQSDNPQFSAQWEDFDMSPDSQYKDSNRWTVFTCVTSYDTNTTTVLTDVVVNILTQNQLENNDKLNNSRWHVNTPLLSSYLYGTDFNKEQEFVDMFVSNNTVFLADLSSINVSIDDVRYTKKDSSVVQLSRNMPFGGIRTLLKGLNNSVVICDTKNNCIANFIYKDTDVEKWGYSFRHQGLGSITSKYKFNTPTDVCTDLNYKLYVSDSLNNCIKIYTDRGEWTYTLELVGTPVSIAIDSSNVLHVLIDKQIYKYEVVEFTLLGIYTCDNILTPTRIRANFSREIIYVCSSNEIVKYFKSGKKYCNIVINLTGITNVYHDNNRNLYVFTQGRILKYYDPMFITNNTNNLAISYWTQDDIKVSRDEYVQDWVYNRAFHRMWDNIELFRSCLKYRYDNSCKSYTAPLYTKDQIFIGQNEIVTSAVVNRCLKYLWLNLQTLYKYFDNTCV